MPDRSAFVTFRDDKVHSGYFWAYVPSGGWEDDERAEQQRRAEHERLMQALFGAIRFEDQAIRVDLARDPRSGLEQITFELKRASALAGAGDSDAGGSVLRFQHEQVSRDGRFSIGIDTRAGDPYLSIPVKNRLIDYEEYYRLSPDEQRRFAADTAAATAFAEECRARLHDDRLILQPGSDRGEPW
ncbi:hypothetical protein [Sphingomonas sp. PB4P5]|uniref:hypothetical protein n=1 Tax=Parasphingomonas puruogangriensis TaxID=3096155 RepID=UPI002FCC232B